MSILVSTTNAIATVTIDRPKVRNAINLETHNELAEVWNKLENDRAVRVIVLTGAGNQSFCAGADIASFLPYLSECAAQEKDPGHFCGLTRDPPTMKPIIAAINGTALGGGLELALACDLRIAADTAVFGVPEVKIGALAGAGGVARLSRFVPPAVAMDMILAGRTIDAKRAYEVGLVSEVVAAADLQSRVREVAACIAANGPLAVRLSKSVARHGANMGLASALELERAAFRRVLLTQDMKEGIAAFQEKRTPVFEGK